MILLTETGSYPIEYVAMKKEIPHTKRIDSMQAQNLIKDVTKTENSESRIEVNKIAEELNVKNIMTVMFKESLKGPNKKK